MMKRWTILLILICWLSVLVTAGTGDFANFNGRAISLKVLQQKLKALHGTNSRPTNLYYLCGINRIMGYVVDEANRDIILIGKVDKKLPPLYLDDFVVALRNAWHKYTELKGNTRYYSNPGCSIDPDPKVYRKLNQVWNQTEDTDEAVKQWEKVCHSPQQVRVFGIPFNTHFARVMVKADYDMKRLVDGSDELSIFAFNSLMGMEFEREKVRMRKGETRAAPINNLNRFWFSPGEYRFLEDDNMVMIERCTVKLLSEEEHLNEEGKFVGAGRANPTAKQFAGDFTGFYDEIAGERPIFRELENLFRFVALAKVLKLKSPHLKIGLNLDYLLERYQISKEKVKAHLPGRYHVRKYEGRTRYDGGNQTFKLWMPSCGGVSIDIEPKSQNFKKDKTNTINNLQKDAIKERVSSDQLSWDLDKKPKEVHILIKRKVRSTKQRYLDCTIGELYVNGEYFCKTLELPFKNAKNKVSSAPVVKNHNAQIRYSRKGKQWRIQLDPVVTYVYDEKDPFIPRKKIERAPIQIHSGNKPKDTEGCILIGEGGTSPFRVYNSKNTLKQLLEKYFSSSKNPDQNIKITVTIQTDYK